MSSATPSGASSTEIANAASAVNMAAMQLGCTTSTRAQRALSAGQSVSGNLASLPEDLLAYAAGYLQQIIEHHDSLVARIGDRAAHGRAMESLAVGKLRRQLRIQISIVEAATEIVDELMACDSSSGADTDNANLVAHRQQLLDEVCGLADQAVPA